MLFHFLKYMYVVNSLTPIYFIYLTYGAESYQEGFFTVKEQAAQTFFPQNIWFKN